MKTKKAIANQFKANELEVGSMGTAPIKGKYKVLNTLGQYDTIYLETTADQVIENANRRFVNDTEKSKWNNKAEKSGSSTQDFSVRNLNVSNAILPTKDGIDIGSVTNRFRGLYVDEAYLSTNTLYIGDTPILGTNDDTIMIKADPNQSITMQTRATGTTKVISESGVELSTSGMNANVVLQAKGSNSQVNVAATGSTNFNAPNINFTGATAVKGNLRAEQDLVVEGNLTVSGTNASLNAANLTIKDNIVEINKGESGTGVTAGKAGIKINRGDSDAFNVIFDETDDMLKIGTETSLKTVATQDWVNSNSARPGHTHTSDQISDATNANTANKIVKRDANGNFSAGTITASLSGNATTATRLQTTRTINGIDFDGTQNITIKADPNAHNQATNTITALTGYAKPSATSALAVGDTLNAALGKLEKGLEGKAPTHNHPYKADSWVPTWSDVTGKPSTFTPASHVHTSADISKMTGYAKGTEGGAIAATDSLNQAVSKLEVKLDGKMDTHTHPYRPNTWVPAWADVTGKPTFHAVATSGSYNDLANKPTIHTINDTSTTSTTNTWSAKKINDSLAGKAASSHTHAHTQITGLGSAATLNAGTGANQLLKLDGSGKIPTSTLPSLAVNETFTTTDETTALTVNLEVGDILVLTAPKVNLSTTYICIDSTKTTFDEKFKALSSGGDSISKGEIQELLNNKVDKVSGKQLSTNDYTTAEKNKLAGIATGANNYVHPSTHAASVIVQDANNRFVTDAEKTAWNGKAAGNHNHDSAYLKLSGGTIAGPLNIGGPLKDTRITTGNQQLVNASATAIYVGNISTPLKLESSANPTITVKSTTHTLYHEGNKPTPADIGAAATSHGNHVPATQTADARKFLRNDNTWQSLPTATTSATGIVQLNDAVNSTSTTQAATANAVKKAYDLANGKAASNHNHDSVYQKIADSWKVEPKKLAAETDLNTLYTSGVYSTDSDGNSVTIVNRPPGSQGFALVVYEIYGTGAAGRQVQVAYMRGNQGIYMRDKAENAAWTAWAKVYTSVTKPTAGEVGALAATGKAVDSAKLNGSSDSINAVANAIAKRDGNGDIAVRLIKSEFANQSTISGAMAFRINNGSDNYIRFCSDTNAIRTFLNTYAKSDVYTKAEADNKYLQKGSAVFTDTISIITPSA